MTGDGSALLGLVAEQARAVLDNPAILPSDNLFDAGLDSVLAVELADRLTGAIGVEIPVAFLYANPTALDLSEVVAEVYGD